MKRMNGTCLCRFLLKCEVKLTVEVEAGGEPVNDEEGAACWAVRDTNGSFTTKRLYPCG